MEVVMEVAMEVITFCAAAKSGLPSRPIEKDLSGSRSSAWPDCRYLFNLHDYVRRLTLK